MSKCSICGREFKNDAGLSGHMRFSHPAAISVDGQKLEERLNDFQGAVIEAVTRLGQRIDEADNLANAAMLYCFASSPKALKPEDIRIMLKQIRETGTFASKSTPSKHSE